MSMPTMDVEIAYVNPPKEGKKKGSIKTREGEYIGVWPDKLHLFKEGERYKIQYKQTQWGKDFFAIVGSKGVPPPQAPSGGISKDEEIFAVGTIQQCLHG